MRAPLLSRRVAEFAWSLDPQFKTGAEGGKLVLRRVLERHVPKALFDRPKAGFEPPVGEWLRGPLRAWAEDLLDQVGRADGGVLDPVPIRARWQAHLKGKNHTGDLWPVLMVLAWLGRR